MTDPDFRVMFHYGQSNITIWFKNKMHARAYRDKTNPKSKCNPSSDRHEITLPALVDLPDRKERKDLKDLQDLKDLKDLDYIRYSDSTQCLIFGFSDEKAAEDWHRGLPLVRCHGKEVWIPRLERDELNKELGVTMSEPGTAEPASQKASRGAPEREKEIKVERVTKRGWDIPATLPEMRAATKSENRRRIQLG